MRDSGAFFGVATGAALIGGLTLFASPKEQAPHSASPEKHRDGGYLGSGACGSCHPSEHSSWTNSYHSTMTREAAELSWDGVGSPSLPRKLELYSRSFRIFQKEDRVFVSGPDLHRVGRRLAALAQEEEASRGWKRKRAEEFFSEEQEVTRQLVLVTGSHHYLAFWLEGGDDRELRQLPFVYLLSEGRFLPRQDAFLQPPDALPRVARWNANCVQCHTVAGKPGQSQGTSEKTGEFWERYETSVVELGIACESCHGPGRTHVEHFRNPATRALSRGTQSKSHIVLPNEKAGARGSQTCGQCHSYFVPRDENTWWSTGFTTNYQAGEPLEDSRLLLSPDEGATSASSEALKGGEGQAFHLINTHRDSIFWEDGSMIVGGREYNGLSLSPCFLKGQGEKRLACTSCHSLHKGKADGQLDPKRLGNQMCTQCHGEVGPEHSRHPAKSAASECTSCHMPKTSYALLQGLASHRISSPTTRFESPPNACALCHVDRSRKWLLDELAAFGVRGEPEPSPDQADDLPLAVVRALSGNAAERAVYAYAFGRPETLEAAGSDVSERLLPLLKEDSYAAIRLIAERSYSFVQKQPSSASKVKLNLDDGSLARLLEERDETPIVISE